MSKTKRTGLGAALLAIASWCVALLAGGRALATGWHADWPLALAGARGVPDAAIFNGLAFVAPGLLVAWVSWRLRASLPASAAWPVRIGTRLAVLAGLAFAAQGLWPLDPTSLDSGSSRYHAAAWMAWASAFVPGALLLAACGEPRPGWRIACGAAGLGVAGVAFGWGTPLAQRVAFAIWLAWSLHAGARADASTR